MPPKNVRNSTGRVGGGGVRQDLSFKREVGGREEGGLFEGRVATFTKKINYNLRYLMTKKLINKNVFLCHN